MFHIAIIQAEAAGLLRRQPNIRRQISITHEPLSNRIRLNEEQLGILSEQYHQWRRGIT